MRAIYFNKSLKFISNYKFTAPTENEVLIKVIFAGICRTDLEIVKGYMDFTGILGHEFVGTVVEGDNRFLNKTVVAEINCGCYSCDLCNSGKATHCKNRTVIGINGRDGAFAEYLIAPVKNLHLVPEGIPLVHYVFVEPLAAAYRILEQVEIRNNSKVAVLGDGKLGLLVAQVIRNTGCKLVVVGKHENRLSILKKMGIDIKFKGEGIDNDFDIVVDCTGSPNGVIDGCNMIRPEGTLVLKTTTSTHSNIPTWKWVVDEIRLIGSRCGPFEPAINAIKDGSVDVAPLIGKTYSLADGIKAFEEGEKKDSLKIILDILER